MARNKRKINNDLEDTFYVFERINGFETSSRTKRRFRVALEIEKEHCYTVFEVGEQAPLILLEHEALVRRGEFHREETPRGIIENIPFVSHPCRSRHSWKSYSRFFKGPTQAPSTYANLFTAREKNLCILLNKKRGIPEERR